MSCSSVVSATEALARNKGLDLVAEIAPGLPTGHGDARRLHQVLLNLVGNAIKFTDVGVVAIRAAAEQRNFVLTVRDTGPGIAPEDHGRIFEEFQQVDSSNTRKKGGTGLGLAISKRMVEMQGGTISVEFRTRQGRDVPRGPADPCRGNHRRAERKHGRRERARGLHGISGAA